jgi:DNA-binding PadR family transcriptional regulator
MNELSFLILTALAAGPRHGYGLLEEIETMTAGAVRPQVATLYRTVDRLEADGAVVEHGTEVVDGRFRRSYRLTPSGLDLLAAEAALRSSTARLATKRVRQATPAPGLAGGAA